MMKKMTGRLLRALALVFCLLLLTGAAQAEARLLKKGLSGEDVAQVETRLIRLGYLTGAAGTQYDSDTVDAVKLFQKANGFTASGQLPIEQQEYMMLDTAVTLKDYYSWCPLKSGDRGTAVEMLQGRLVVLGYYRGEDNGSYNKDTKTAVSEFQAANGLKATGSADTETRRLMNTSNVVKASEYYKICPLKSGQTHAAVQVLQNRLYVLGYYTGRATGKYDTATKDAVSEFQSAMGMAANGKADEITRRAMISDQAVPASEYYKTCSLRYNKTHPAVSILKKRLTELKFYSGAIDNNYDKTTKAAVTDFQNANGIKATGNADTATRVAMNSAQAVNGAEYNRVRELKYNQTGEAVRVLQTRLKELGFYNLDLNAKFDKATKTAVSEFQTASGMKATGAADTYTRQAMNAAGAVNAAAFYQTMSLSYGTESAGVRVLEQQLTALGFFTGKLGNKYDKDVKEAVTLFQSANEIKTSGKADLETRQAMLKPDAVNMAAYNLVRPLSSGSTGDSVKQLQTRLQKLGYYTAAVNGKYDNTTKEAVKTFQTANGLSANGKASVADRKLMNSDAAVTCEVYDTWRALKKGATGRAVELLQQRLSQLGYYCFAVNGKYDDNTRVAVKTFQTANGLSANGTASVETRRVMNEPSALNRETYDLTRTLKKGETGATVRAMQQRLSQLGYYVNPGVVTYDKALVDAVKLFQTANGLPANGNADTETRRVMMSAEAVSYDTYCTFCPVKYNEKSNAVSIVQRQLLGLGYYTGSVDGHYSSGMKSAVFAFEEANGFKADTTISVEMRKLLNAGTAVNYGDYCKTCPLSRGNKGEAVRMLQYRLRELGYFNDAVTGTYGTSTANAVALFQTANDMKSTGTADANTRAEMNLKTAVTKAEYDRRVQEEKENEENQSKKDKIDKVIDVAMSKLGCKYVSKSSGPDTFDCSNFTKYCFAQVGIKLSGAVLTQGYMTNYSKITNTNKLKRGDLLIFDTVEDNDLADHAGIYLGDDKFIHASSARGEVVISNFTQYGHFSWAFRLI